MVQRLFFDITKQRDHKYATDSPGKQFYVFLATAPTGVSTAGPPLKFWQATKSESKGIAMFWISYLIFYFI